jgi:hypothetical protein
MNQRDLELLSSYLDGEIKPSDSTRLEARLQSESELVSVLNDLRAARTLLRKMPQRRAPRNFTLTRKMVGQNPPLPRAYPAFRFATVFATLLFFFSFGFNTLSTQLAVQAPAYGMGGGGGADTELFAADAPQADASAAAESAPVEEPFVAMAPPASTENAPSEDATRIVETPSAKDGEVGGGAPEQPQIVVDTMPRSPLVPRAWQIGFLVAALIGVVLMQLMRRISAQRWK